MYGQSYCGHEPDTKEFETRLEAEINVCRSLTSALFDYLTFSPRMQLENMRRPAPRPTAEELIQAIEWRDDIQCQIDKQADVMANMPEAVRPMMAALTGSIENILERQLNEANARVSSIQTAMEAEG